MSDEGKVVEAAAPVEAQTTVADTSKADTAITEPAMASTKDSLNGEVVNGAAESSEAKEKVATDAPARESEETAQVTSEQTKSANVTPTEAAEKQDDAETKEATKPDEDTATADASDEPSFNAPASAIKLKGRRKSGISEHKGKKLNKKASKAKMTHIDAKPGDFFYVKLKGWPSWPVVVCDESMLPLTLTKSRPVTALRQDGTYRDDFADGGPKVKDRSFAVMFLQTNEFSWVPNTELIDLDLETVGDIKVTRKDLQLAHELCATNPPLSYFKDLLSQFEESRIAEEEKKEAAAAEKAAKAAKKAEKSAKKEKPAKVVADEEGDLDMPDADMEPQSDENEDEPDAKKAGTKRKYSQTPKETESVKKQRTTLKLNVGTPKSAKASSTPKPAKEQSAAKPAKSAKPKAKKIAKGPEPAAPAANVRPDFETPKMREGVTNEEEKHALRMKEVMFLRHKLQKALLTKEVAPNPEEMSVVDKYYEKLEAYNVIETSIIKGTKINKVLKNVIKLPSGFIPREEEFSILSRSHNLLERWNKSMAQEAANLAGNGTSAEANGSPDDGKTSVTEASNGTKEPPVEAKAQAKVEKNDSDAKDDAKVDAPNGKTEASDDVVPAATEEPTKDTVVEAATVEATA
jgi:hypothetical protein